MSNQLILESNVTPDEFSQKAGRRFYVEGEEDSIDTEVVEALTKGLGLSVRPLGTSSNIRIAVNALHADHPNYAYLIDRDYLEEPSVEDAWSSFPDPAKGNLLIWRKRSIENYFLDLDWLSKSAYFVPGKKPYLIDKLEKIARTRVFLDAGNLTIGVLRGAVFKHSIRFDGDTKRYRTRAEGRASLLARPEWRGISSAIMDELALENVEALYESTVADMLGGKSVPKFGVGTWIDRMNAKPLLDAVLNSSAFEVLSTSGVRKLSDRQKRSAIIRELIHRGEGLPGDFSQVRDMLKRYLARPA